METLPMPALSTKVRQLEDVIAQFDGCVVAFSGGVDSAVVAQAAFRGLGKRAVAVTGVSASLAAAELEQARQTARQIGIRHELVETDELSRPDYRRNAADRCFHCKTTLYTSLRALADAQQLAVIANGANLDDVGDHRPGMQAAQDFGVRSPLIEAGLGKPEVRRLAQDWGLPVWDKPASPCLSSRVAYGTEVTRERLAMIEQAEAFLREWGLREFRVRLHDPDMARIEVRPEDLAFLVRDDLRRVQLTGRLKQLGFRYITLDLEGFRSGNLNQMIDIQDLRK